VPGGEFELIERHLSALGVNRADVKLGVGDDAALVDPQPAAQLRCASAHLVLSNRTTQQINAAIQATFQNLAMDLRKVGNTPAWATLALTLPQADSTLVAMLASTVHSACLAQNIAVIGGDTTSGEASLTIFLTGLAQP
jgi:thiamine-monophosphate kinase